MLPLELDKVRQNVQKATIEDLLDRVTVYRDGMESEALEVIEAELEARGVTPAEMLAHEARRERTVMRGPDGIAVTCSFCHRPAVVAAWGFGSLFGRVWGLGWLFRKFRLFPRRVRYCADHAQDPPLAPE